MKVPRLLVGSAAWGWRILVTAATIALLAWILIRLYVIVVPVILALFLAAVLEPLASRLRRRRFPPALAAAIVFLGALATIGLALWWIGSNVASEFDELGQQIEEAVDSAKEWATGEPLNLTEQRVDELEQTARSAVRNAAGGVAQQAAGQARVVGEVIGGFLLMLFALFFLLKDGAKMADWIKQRIPPANRDDAVAITRHARYVVRQYLVATAATGFLDAVLIAMALLLLDVPLVLPLAVLTFFGGFVPLVGATVAGTVAAVVALVTKGLVTALLVVAATVAVQQIEGNLLQPLILERAVRLHALVTGVAVASGLVLGGILGAFISVPLVAIGVGVGSHFRKADLAAQAAAGPTGSLGLGAGPPPCS